jgi:hypothetical protein
MTNEIALIKNNLTGLKIREHDDDTIKSSIAILVQKMFLIAGQTPEKKDITIICREVCNDLQKRYKGMTLNEVDYALNAGVRGEYGEYYGINVVSINKWLRAYYNSEERREAQRSKIFPELALPQSTALTDREILEIKLDAYNKALSLANEGKYVKDRGNLVYNFLDERGKISFTSAEKSAFIDRAKIELEAEARARAKDARTPRPVSYFVDEITDNSVTARAKQIALNEYLKRKMMEEF